MEFINMNFINETFPEYAKWAWLIAGTLLMMVEVFVPGVFVVWLGLAAVLTGITLSIFSDITVSYQLLTFSILSVICVFIGWYVYGKVLVKSSNREYSDLNNGAQSFVGKEYSVLEDSTNGRSRVKIGDTVWLVESKDELKEGDAVIIESVDGIVLHVKKKKK